MSASFGVRITNCGPNRLAVIARARGSLRLSPAEARNRLDSLPAIIVDDIHQWDAFRIASEFERLGAEVQVYVSTPCRG